MNDDTVTKLLEAFQECRKRGDQARLFLETRNGRVFANLAVEMPASHPVLRPVKTKTPSSRRRDRKRMENFLQRRKYQQTFSTSTPEKSNQPLITSSISDVEPSSITDTTSCEIPQLDSRAGNRDQDPEETTPAEEKPNFLDELLKNKEMFEDFKKALHEGISQAIPKAIKEIPKAMKTSMNEIQFENNSVTENRIDDEDNIEDAKMWAISQKQSMVINDKKGTHTQV